MTVKPKSVKEWIDRARVAGHDMLGIANDWEHTEQYRGQVYLPDMDGGVFYTRVHCNAISSLDPYGLVPLEDMPEDVQYLYGYETQT